MHILQMYLAPIRFIEEIISSYDNHIPITFEGTKWQYHVLVERICYIEDTNLSDVFLLEGAL